MIRIIQARANFEREPMSPIDPDPNTCRFYGRCPIGQDICHREMPQLELRGGSHPVACHTPLAARAPASAT